MNHFKEFFRGLIAKRIATTQGPTDSQPGTYVTMPLREFLDALWMFSAQQSEQEHWVEVCLDFVAYDCISVNFFMHGEEPGRSSEPEREEAGE